MYKAAALSHANTSAPRVLASGRGHMAKRIIDKAKEFDIPLFASEELVDTLLCVDISDEIPPHLYEAVVRVFIWLHRLEASAQLSQDS